MRPADRRAIGRGALLATLTWLVLSAEILLSNVVFPATGDDDALPVLVSYVGIFAVLVLAGVLAARDGAGPRGRLVAGAVAGAMIGALTVATFVVVDNVWLDVVARQQTKIDGFAHSGDASMRAYLNHGLIGPAVFLTLALGGLGAALSGLGGLAGPRTAEGLRG